MVRFHRSTPSRGRIGPRTGGGVACRWGRGRDGGGGVTLLLAEEARRPAWIHHGALAAEGMPPMRLSGGAMDRVLGVRSDRVREVRGEAWALQGLP